MRGKNKENENYNDTYTSWRYYKKLSSFNMHNLLRTELDIKLALQLAAFQLKHGSASEVWADPLGGGRVTGASPGAQTSAVPVVCLPAASSSLWSALHAASSGTTTPQAGKLQQCSAPPHDSMQGRKHKCRVKILKQNIFFLLRVFSSDNFFAIGFKMLI